MARTTKAEIRSPVDIAISSLLETRKVLVAAAASASCVCFSRETGLEEAVDGIDGIVARLQRDRPCAPADIRAGK